MIKECQTLRKGLPMNHIMLLEEYIQVNVTWEIAVGV